MGFDCYYYPGSSPCRAILLLAKHLGISLNLKLVNLMAGDQFKPDFLKINPMHQIPTLKDEDGFVLYESRAILQYLGNAFGSDSVYPKNPKERFVVDQRLFFDQGVLYQSFAEAYYGKVFAGKKVDPNNIKALNEALGHVNTFLTQTKYIAADRLTIADFAIVASLSTFDASGHDVQTDFPAIKQYLERCKAEMKGYRELNQQGADQFGQFVSAALAKP